MIISEGCWAAELPFKFVAGWVMFSVAVPGFGIND